MISGIDNWILMAFLTPIAWALVNLLDVYFSKEVYSSPYDGATISSIFQSLFLILPICGLVEFSYNGLPPLIVGVLSGILFQLACLYYFKSLFLHSDVIWVQIIWNLNMAVVPILSFFILKQSLSLQTIGGIIAIFAGSSLLVFDHKISIGLTKNVSLFMLSSMLLFSLSKVCEAAIFTEFNTPFTTGYTYFSFGSFLVATWNLIFQKTKLDLLFKFWGRFSFAESLSIIATISSERAIFLKGSSSLVVLIEGYTPLFTLLFTYIALLFG